MVRLQHATLLVLLLAALPANAGFDDWLQRQLGNGGVDAKTAAAGLREALEQGTRHAVQTLGRENGFLSHPTLRIPMPPALQKAEKALRRLGQDKAADDFVRSLNRAAEQATPAARDIFVDAIRKMSVKDAIGIVKGPRDAATQYFRRHTEAQLTGAFRPIVTRATASVGVTASYKKFAGKLEPLGLVDKKELDLDGYVTDKAFDGLFTLVAEEEQRIREDPVARTTQLLRKVFK